jgi:hypothetical protein
VESHRFTRRSLLGRGLAAGVALSGIGAITADAALASSRRLYCFINGSLVMYAVGGWHQVGSKSLPMLADGPRGIVCHLGIGSIWVTHGADTGTGGRLLRYDVASNAVLWDRPLGFGCDQPAITLDGRHLYVPEGEKSPRRLWHILDPLTGVQKGTISGPSGPHNTIARPQHMYLAGVGEPYVYLDNGHRIGPLANGCRPFTVDAAEQRIYTTASHTRGFQVSDIQTGEVLSTVKFGTVPKGFTVSAPSHGISLSPDGSEVWVLDMPAQLVRVYTSGAAPKHLADVKISPISGVDKPPTALDKIKAGWVLHSRRGDYVYVGDSGSVISTRTRTQVAFLPALANGRHGYIEAGFDLAGLLMSTSTHFGMSY